MLTDAERRKLLLGDVDRALPNRVPLNAGPLTLSFEGGDLRYICFGDQEIVRRIYVALRGENWLTVPATIDDVAIDSHADRFVVAYNAHYLNAEKGIDFVARFTLTGDPDGTITFDFAGEAHSSFQRNRIGICVCTLPK